MYLCALKTIGMTGQKTPTALGTEKIGKLLMQYAIPVIIAMTASSLYNMVDSIFIGHGVGAMAISGLALTFPLMNLAAAFGSLVGVGAATLVSVKLGQKDYDTAQRVLGNVLVLNIISRNGTLPSMPVNSTFLPGTFLLSLKKNPVVPPCNGLYKW